jgi:hypothetical protein
VRERLLAASASTIDRLLTATRAGAWNDVTALDDGALDARMYGTCWCASRWATGCRTWRTCTWN